MLVTTIYYLLSAVTFYKLLNATAHPTTGTLDLQGAIANQTYRAPLAATALGALLVFGFNIFSCIILIK